MITEPIYTVEVWTKRAGFVEYKETPQQAIERFRHAKLNPNLVRVRVLSDDGKQILEYYGAEYQIYKD